MMDSISRMGGGLPSAMQGDGGAVSSPVSMSNEAQVHRTLDQLWGAQATAGAPAIQQADVEGLIRALSPELLVAAVQIGARDAQESASAESVRGAQARGELAELERRKAMEQAEKAAKKATRLLGLKKFFGKLVKAVAVAASAAATVVTGGAASGVALAGAALVMGADLVAKACEKMGLVSGKGMQRLAMALRITGALMSAGGGLAATAGAKAGSALAKSLSAGFDAARGVAHAADGAAGVGLHVQHGKQQGHLAQAEAARASSQQASADMEAIVEELRTVLATFGRVQSRLQESLAVQGEARRAAVQQLA